VDMKINEMDMKKNETTKHDGVSKVLPKIRVSNLFLITTILPK